MQTKILEHPVFESILAELRDKNTRPPHFRALAERAGLILAVESTKSLLTTLSSIETPLTSCDVQRLSNRQILVPILRAGLSMVSPFQKLLPQADLGHIGLKRDELSAKASSYLLSMPDLSGADVFVLDPMLATGGSATVALELIYKYQVKSVNFVSIIAAPEGIQKIESQFPNVKLTVGVVDIKLNQDFFIVPGLGDFGDRLFGT